jgi:titin
MLLSTYMVTNTNDSGTGSLRQAILDSNGNTGPNLIDFNIPGSGVHTIIPTSALPTITQAVTIDETSQPGYSGTPLIELDGASAGASANGLTISAGNTTVQGLVINRFTTDSINLTTSGNRIIGDYIGTDVTGTIALANGGNGVSISGTGASNNMVGGIAAGAGNVIAGNAQTGIVISGGASGNLVQGNRIGTDVSGARALANLTWGVVIASFGTATANNTVGGTTPAARNVISGNSFSGVFLWDVSGNAVQGNYVGADVTGTLAVANGGDGVTVNGSNNLIGGTAAGAGNLLSGNTGAGVSISKGSSSSTGNLVQGNLIGTMADGQAALANGQHGVAITGVGTSNNLVGGTVAAARNVISGSLHNNGVGIFQGATANTVQGNYIGTDVSGTVALANAVNGVGVSDAGTSNNTIGGTVVGAGNVISGNLNAGIQFFGASSGNVVQGNFIGTDVSGTQPLGNTYAGVAVSGASNNTIGGTATGAGNLISGNIGNGVRVELSGTAGNLVQGNLIGTDMTGTLALGNGTDGLDSAVLLDTGASNNTVGGTVAGAGNVISADSLNGVRIRDSSNNVVQGNLIGTDVTGTQPLGNAADGVAVSGTASGNLIAGNVIAANSLDGVHFFSGTTGNTVQRNFIGTDPSGSLALGNGLNGVHFEDTSDNNIIGGTGAGNTIAFSGNDGVLVDTASGDLVSQNSIHDSGNLGIELLNGGNNSQAYPVLMSATSDGNSTTIVGTLTSTPDTTFTLEFFANNVPNGSGYGEGQQFLGFWTVTTDDSGNASFTATFVTGDTTGLFIAATATDPANNTSSFSQDVTVNGPASQGHAGLDLGAVALAARAWTDPDSLLTGQSSPATRGREAAAGQTLAREMVDQVFSAGEASGREPVAFFRPEVLPRTGSLFQGQPQPGCAGAPVWPWDSRDALAPTT